MKKAFSIISLFLSIASFSQDKFTFAFDYDTTKIYLTYADLTPFFKKENLNIISETKSLTKNDTLFLARSWLDGLYHVDTLEFDLNFELFKAINNKRGAIVHKGKLITSFYTKKAKIKVKTNRHFKEIYYYEKISKKHFLTKIIKDYPLPDDPAFSKGHILN